MTFVVVICLIILGGRRAGRWMGRLLEGPDVKLRRRLERGEISEEEFREKMRRLEACG